MKVQLSLSAHIANFFGPLTAPNKTDLPQYAVSKRVAQVLYIYSSNSEDTKAVVKVQITMNKVAKNADVAAAIAAGKLNIDMEVTSEASAVAKNKKLRALLQKQGFDGYFDSSLLESSEPLQCVPFSMSQVKPR